MSSVCRGWLQCDFAAWRNSFMAGLLAAGVVGTLYLPSAFDSLPESYTLKRAILSGLLVGAGSALGNGCTSGHGIAGNARYAISVMWISSSPQGAATYKRCRTLEGICVTVLYA